MAVTLAIGVACTPAFNWREVRPEQTAAVALFPCKPSSHARRVRLASREVEMILLACQTANVRFSLAFADVADTAQVGPALAALRASAIANLGGTWQLDGSLAVPGMTPNADAQRGRVTGHLPDGTPARMVVGIFAKDTRVFQASVVFEGERAPSEVVDTFFGGLQLPV